MNTASKLTTVSAQEVLEHGSRKLYTELQTKRRHASMPQHFPTSPTETPEAHLPSGQEMPSLRGEKNLHRASQSKRGRPVQKYSVHPRKYSCPKWELIYIVIVHVIEKC